MTLQEICYQIAQRHGFNSHEQCKEHTGSTDIYSLVLHEAIEAYANERAFSAWQQGHEEGQVYMMEIQNTGKPSNRPVNMAGEKKLDEGLHCHECEKLISQEEFQRNGGICNNCKLIEFMEDDYDHEI